MGFFNPCACIGTFFTLAAVLLLIFAELSQIVRFSRCLAAIGGLSIIQSASQRVPRSLRLVQLDTTSFANGLRAAAGNNANLTALFASGARSGDGTGIRNYYEWGFWGYCSGSGTNNDADYCDGTSFGYGWRPADVLLSDVPSAQQTLVASVLPNSTFIASNYLGTYTTVAFYLVFIGAIIAGIALICSITAHRWAFLLGAASSFLAFLLTGVGAAIWSIMIAKVRSSVNGVQAADGTSLGLYVNYGDALWVLWAAVGCLLIAVIPLFVACCVGRDDYGYGGRRNTYSAEKDEYAPSTHYSERPLSRAGTARTGRSSRYGSQYAGSIRY